MKPNRYTRALLKHLGLALALGVGVGSAQAQGIIEVGGNGAIADTELGPVNCQPSELDYRRE